MSPDDIHAGLDTSVVLRLLVGQPEDQYSAAIEFLAGVEHAGGRVLVSNLVIAKAYFACQHHYGLAKSDVLAGLHVLLSRPTFLVHPDALTLLAREGMASAKPGFLDRLIHAEYSELGAPLATFEKPARRLPRVRVLGAGN
jgi:predicted nucleic-acid-binding protein